MKININSFTKDIEKLFIDSGFFFDIIGITREELKNELLGFKMIVSDPKFTDAENFWKHFSYLRSDSRKMFKPL